MINNEEVICEKTLCITLSLLLLITSMPFSTFAKDIVKSTETKNGESYETIQKEEDNNMSEREKLAVEKFNELYKDSKIPENIANSDWDFTCFKRFNNCYILLLNSPQTLENIGFIADELSLIVSLVLYRLISVYELW